MQGVRIQFDEKSRQTDVGKLHGSIRQGLQSVKSISYDIASIASPTSRQSINSFNQPKFDQNIIASTSSIQEPQLNVMNSYDEEKISHLARLSIADQELNRTMNPSKQRDQTGSDLILSTVTESIISTSYAQSLENIRSTAQKNTK